MFDTVSLPLRLIISLSNNLTVCSIFIVLMLLMTAVSALSTSFSTLAKANILPGDFKNNQSNVAYFGCEKSGDTEFQCTPSINEINAYSTSATAGLIYSSQTGNANYVKGPYGDALHFTSYLGEYVGMQKIPSMQLFSISFWVKDVPWFHDDAPIISFVNSQSNAGWVFDMQDDGKNVRFGLATMSDGLVSAGVVPVGSTKFVHIIGTFDGSNIKMYRDGNLYNVTKIHGPYNPDPGVNLRIGLNAFDTQNSWAGSISDLRIYDRPLSDIEVRKIHNNTENISDGLVGHWTFNGNLNDTSGNNNHAALFFQTSSMIFSPDGRLFFSEKRTGEVKIMKNDIVLDKAFVKLSDLFVGDHEGLLGITLDPKFETNHYVYVYCTQVDNNTGSVFNSVLRFTDANDTGINMTVIMNRIPADPGGYYSGGALAFGPDSKLYVTIGISTYPQNAQNVSSVLGKVLRLNRDGTVPSDNPFPGSPVFALGNKNPYGIAFDTNGNGILTDNGYAHFDEINVIRKGGNYGFPITQAPTLSSLYTQSSFISPIRTYYEVIAPTQAIFYSGSKYPALHDKFVIASYDSRDNDPLRAIHIGKNNTLDEMSIDLPDNPKDNIIALAQSPQGDLYFAGYNIYKLKSIALGRMQTLFPIKLTASPGIEIGEVKVSLANSSISIDYTGATVSKNISSSIQLQIPKNLLSGIYSVSTNTSKDDAEVQTSIKESTLVFKIDTKTHPQFTDVSVILREPNKHMKIIIHGIKVLPHMIHDE